MPAPATPLRPATPARTPDPAAQATLAELAQLGLAVARVASQLAEVEGQALAVLADAAAHATRVVLQPAASLADALEAGRNADISDAARDAIAARLASITATFDKAARAVRRTVALQARLADPRPFRTPPPSGEPPRSAQAPAKPRPPANDAERPDSPDRPETGNEISGKTDQEVLEGIRRDLAGAATLLPAAPRSAPIPPPPTTPTTREPPTPAHPPDT